MVAPPPTAAIAPEKAAAPAGLKTQVSKDDAASCLAASRQRLRQTLLAIAAPPSQPSLLDGGIGNVGNRLLDRIKSLPMASALLEGLSAWWRRHPLHRAANAADAASKKLLGRAARRQPGAVILIAIGSGILLAYGRPWRLLLSPGALLSAIGQVGRYALRGPSAKAWKEAVMQRPVDASAR
jgi:hypothetical protein